MKGLTFRNFMPSRLSWSSCVCLLLAVYLLPAAAASQSSVDELIEQTYRAAYNLDYEEALEHAQRAIALAPQMSAAHRALASVLWFRIAFLRGAVTLDHYFGGVADGRLALPKPAPDLDAAFKQTIAKAIELAEAALRRNPKDLGAKNDLGRAYALQASYAASVENSTVSALKAAMRAYDEEEAVISQNPNDPGATFIVGTYRYLIGSLSLPSRMFAYLVGFGGGKERGLAMVETAEKDPGTRLDAQLALFLIYTREGRHGDALRMIRALAAAYPRNRLFVLEEGATAIRADHAAEAEAILTRGLEAFDRDPRLKVPGERGLWLYKRGVARLVQRHIPDSQADLVDALAAQPPGWLRGRIHIEIGKTLDLTGRREEAVASYRMARSLCETNNDPVGINSANRWIGKPFGK
jgi:tetratricopeptide (TPR) repeat protein